MSKKKLTEREIELAVGNTIADLAFEGMYVTEEEIARLYRIARGETTAEEEVAIILAKYRKETDNG